jgi:hypothetical protein
VTPPREPGKLIPDALCEELRQDVLNACDISRWHTPPPRRARRPWARMLPGRLRRRRPRLTEAEYAATIPARMDAVAAELNERLGDVLPPGTRFEWTTEES